jgi:cytochrome c biogenesis protein CcmG, thiol:disulfide interchange protein DsbE
MIRRLFPAIAAVVVAASCTSAAVDGGPAVVEVSGKVPTVSGRSIEGQATIGPQTYAGRPAVFNFWASWCGPCRREQPVLAATARRLGADGPAFIGVNFRDDPAAARAFLREFDVGYPSVEDASGTLAYRFDVPNLPATIFVDAEGQMRYRVVGALDRPGLLRSLIDKISR